MRVTYVNILVIKYSTRKSTVLAYAYNKIPKVWAPHVQTKKISESLPPTHPPPPFPSFSHVYAVASDGDDRSVEPCSRAQITESRAEK